MDLILRVLELNLPVIYRFCNEPILSFFLKLSYQCCLPQGRLIRVVIDPSLISNDSISFYSISIYFK